MKGRGMKDYCAFGIVLFFDGKIPLVVDKGNFSKKMWKLPGGKRLGRDQFDPKDTLVRELYDEIGVTVRELVTDPFFIKEKTNKAGGKYDFIVFSAYWYSGVLTADEVEIDKVELFEISQIMKMIRFEEVLPDHAEAIIKYFNSYR